ASTALPFLRVDNFRLNNVSLHYKSVPDEMAANSHLSEFLIQLPKGDLAGQEFRVEQIVLDISTINVKKPAAKSHKAAATLLTKEANKEPFVWPDWDIQAESVAFQNNHLAYQNGKKPENIAGFNPDYINLKDFTLKADNISLDKNEKL